jgi:hypothetical protein
MQKWKTLQNVGAWIAVIAGIIFTAVGMLGVWKVFGSEEQIIFKSLSSLAILCFAGLVFLGLGKLGASMYREGEAPTLTGSARAAALLVMCFLTVPHAVVLLYAIWTGLDYGDLFMRAITSFFVLLVGSVVVTKAIEALDRRAEHAPRAPMTPPASVMPSAPPAPVAPSAPTAPGMPAMAQAPGMPDLSNQFPQYQHAPPSGPQA